MVPSGEILACIPCGTLGAGATEPGAAADDSGRGAPVAASVGTSVRASVAAGCGLLGATRAGERGESWGLRGG